MPADFIRPPTAFSLDPYRKGGRIEDRKHLAFVRTLPCLATGAWGPSEAAHLRGASPLHGKGTTGMGTKPDDRWTVPMCHSAHMRQHTMNEAAFWEGLGINPFSVASLIYEHTGNFDDCLVIIAQARSAGARPPWGR